MKTQFFAFLALFALVACQEKAAPNPTPKASFSFQTGVNGLVVFTNTSLNATDYLWNFGDGTTSVARTISHTYTKNATYGVTLTAKSSAGSDVSNGSVKVDNIKGEMTIYKGSNAGNGRNIEVFVDGVSVGQINGAYYYTSAPNCGQKYTVGGSYSEGSYTITARETSGLNRVSWGPFKMSITGGRCNTQALIY